jgi:predicted nucleic acid-binding protein
VYDGLVALAAREHGVALATRDARARGTYDAVGVQVVLVV